MPNYDGRDARQSPQTVRYVKNGSGGRWWQVAKERGQLHCGWWFIPRDLLCQIDLARIKDFIKQHEEFKTPGAATADFNALKVVLDRPSQHIWITFEEGYLWWCTVRDGITVNMDTSKEREEGSFWLTCDRPWNNRSVGGRLLREQAFRAKLPQWPDFERPFASRVAQPRDLQIVAG